ncbi:MAG: hypothetical protein IRY99_12725, partial [Isosphaeraceae bacterium]|nr:hypothetical protein [Isosphaeraceae bacterium]
MSQPSRPQARALQPRPRRRVRIEGPQELEDRQLLAPYLPVFARTATFTALPNQPAGQNLGTITVSESTTPLTTSAAGYVSVSQFAPASEFGNDIVRIQAGPGGDFGKGIYAISRGAGDNNGQNGAPQGINRPGVIYRVDPATGKASIFFDLNTVINQLEPGGNASNGLLPSTGLLNWYDITFDTEGIFDGKPSMFVSSVSRTDPNKNVIYRIGPDGSFLGLYIPFTGMGQSGAFQRSPSAILVPPPEQQSFLRGLLAGNGAGSSAQNGTVAGGFAAVFFDANQYQPGTPIGTNLPTGANPTQLTYGPQTSLNSANTFYNSPVYSTFTDFGLPAAGGLPGVPGLSGVQGLGGELLINGGAPIVTGPADPNAAMADKAAAITTDFRRFEDAAFDYYGYFSYGTTVTPGTGGAPATVANPPVYAGSLFVADLGTGLTVPVTAPAPLTGTFNIPVQGPGTGGVTAVNGQPVFTFPSGNLGGRIVRIDPSGNVTTFAEGFRTSGSYGPDSFFNSSLSLTFSADGTTLYVADDDGIWQFKSVMSLADSTSGQLIGLNDLRTFGVPYEGQDEAVAVVDTGVDAATPNFRGRIAPGTNVLTNGFGNDDLAAGTGTTTGGTTTPSNGHGTPMAGVIAQFVPQATIVPVNVFAPGPTTTTTAGVSVTNNNAVYNGMSYLVQNPFVADPIRPGKLDRVVVANFGFGTTTTYDVEGTAYRKNKQLIIAFKNQLHKLRQAGITPIMAAGQFGVPSTAPQGAAAGTVGDFNGLALPAVLNEAISVSGVYPFPFSESAASPPTDPSPGPLGRLPGPVLITQPGAAGAPPTFLGNLATLAAADTIIFKDKLLNAANRNVTLDYVAPAADVPTFRRTFQVAAGAAPNSQFATNDFTEGGTSLSSAIVTGAFATVASALDYWSDINKEGTTTDGYLTTPAGVHQLNFGPHSLPDLSAYANPDGINAILQWTAVPDIDQPNLTDNLTKPTLFNRVDYRTYSRIDIGNAIGAIEATVALKWLFDHGTFDLIDANHNGLITAEELQNFENTATQIGMPEAGAMARLLGGTARTGIVNISRTGMGLDQPTGTIPRAPIGQTLAGQMPDQPDALQRRFNLLDYAANGELKGAISIDQLRMLTHYLLPAPDAFVTVDRQRASADGYLLSPSPHRNWSDLQHLLPKYVWVPKSIVKRFVNVSPARFGINRGVPPATGGPTYTLFEPQAPKKGHGHPAQSAPPAANPEPASPPSDNQQPTDSGSPSQPGTSNASSPPSNDSGSNATPTSSAPTATNPSTTSPSSSTTPAATVSNSATAPTAPSSTTASQVAQALQTTPTPGNTNPTGNPIADALLQLHNAATSGTGQASTATAAPASTPSLSSSVPRPIAQAPTVQATTT